MKTGNNPAPEKIKDLNDFANIPDEDIDLSEIPETDWTGKIVRGLTQMPPKERAEAIAYLKSARAQTPNAPPPPKQAPPRKIRYAHAEMDHAIRHCAAQTETPQKDACGAQFRVSDYPPGYFPYKYQVQKGSYVDACPICEIKLLKRAIDKSDDDNFTTIIRADLKFLQNHHNPRPRQSEQQCPS